MDIDSRINELKKEINRLEMLKEVSEADTDEGIRLMLAERFAERLLNHSAQALTEAANSVLDDLGIEAVVLGEDLETLREQFWDIVRRFRNGKQIES